MRKISDKPAWQTYKWRDSKERILIGATVAFSRKGFYGTSVREISLEAGLEQPSIYHHFGSKENLYWSCLRATHLFMIRNLRRRMVKQATLEGEIRQMFRAVGWFHAEYPEFFALMFSLVYSSPREIGDRYTSLYGGDIFQFVANAFDRHPPRTGRLEKYSLTVHTLYSHILSYSGSRPKNLHISYFQALRKLFRAL
ncbi:MAG: TetR/AcrR family transcriptional regulator [Spirochaetes bacterium]|nr:TetR/AcrR family transcriptional regulator [Spirochaetota bacterium]MBX3722436.1 TetR/AcrR family transcriptional regulator [Turneriella sp.]